VAISVKLSLPASITADGSIMFASVPQNPISILANQVLQGSNEFTNKVIQDYDLNGELEVAFRVNNKIIAQFESPPEDKTYLPSQSLRAALGQVMALNRNAHKHANLANPLRSMLYANVITIMETFLSDYLICWLEKDELLVNNLTRYDQFRKEKFSLSELISLNVSIKQIVIDKMKEVIYHNLPLVSHIYSAVFNIRFPEIGELVKAVENRHDIVHRNGIINDGVIERRKQYSKEDIMKLVVDLQVFLIDILKAINSAK
jgi:hypothetical protein